MSFLLLMFFLVQAVATIPPTQSTAEYVGPTGNVTKYHGTRIGHVDAFTEEEQRKYEEVGVWQLQSGYPRRACTIIAE